MANKKCAVTHIYLGEDDPKMEVKTFLDQPNKYVGIVGIRLISVNGSKYIGTDIAIDLEPAKIKSQPEPIDLGDGRITQVIHGPQRRKR